ncbi:BnaC07g50950D [Brassica napus]|uniref:BnaC07g50950D protein n=3 Tax=Brassica TaxID=3705 RepID=A0A078J935_BRANA|nr:BnaC07g50950D [Brassica napus]
MNINGIKKQNEIILMDKHGVKCVTKLVRDGSKYGKRGLGKGCKDFCEANDVLKIGQPFMSELVWEDSVPVLRSKLKQSVTNKERSNLINVSKLDNSSHYRTLSFQFFSDTTKFLSFSANSNDDERTLPLIEIGQKSHVPIVSYSATSPFLASIRSQYFFQATYDDSSQVHAVKAIIKLFGWREVVPVYVDNTFGEGIMPHLTDALQEINVRIPYRTVISPNATGDEISVELLRMMTRPTRVFVVHTEDLLASRFFAKAKEIGLMKQGYIWILITNSITDGLSLMKETETDAMQGREYVPRSDKLEAFKSKWKNRFPVSDLSVYGLWAYDATTALALAIEEAGTSNLIFVKTDATMRNMSGLQGLGVSQYGPKLLQTLSKVRFKGLSGDFRFINRELQPSVLEIVNVNGHGGRTIGYWTKEHGLFKHVDQRQATTTTFTTWKDRLRPIIWPGDTTFVPKGWEIPTNGKRLKIGVPTNNHFPQFVKGTKDPITNSTIFSGFCIDYFEAVIQAMPYDVSYDFFPVEDMDYETMVYQVYLGTPEVQC